jgi:hypothetical protein
MNRRFFLTIFGYNSHRGADCQEKSAGHSNTQTKKRKTIKVRRRRREEGNFSFSLAVGRVGGGEIDFKPQKLSLGPSVMIFTISPRKKLDKNGFLVIR